MSARALSTIEKETRIARTAEAIENSVLVLAGLTLERRAALLAKAVEHALACLEANDASKSPKQASEQAQAQARKDLIKVALGSEHERAAYQGAPVVIPIPRWAQGLAVVAPPRAAHVGEAQVVDVQGDPAPGTDLA